ncbi:hypothetical protein G6F24_017757 [Rhizopus arrhizus]|nr:hypothetical protein G6F24_017757 [Rhizopus arrhizus]
MASVLLGLVQVNDAAARLQGDGSAPARGYQRMGLDTSAVDATLLAIEHHAGDRPLGYHGARCRIHPAGAGAAAAARHRRRCHAAPGPGVCWRAARAARSGQPAHGPGHRAR